MDMKYNFDEIKEVKIESSERSALAGLNGDRGWLTLRRIVESYILQLTSNLINGTETEKDSSVDELKALRGFVRYWKNVVDLVENKEHH